MKGRHALQVGSGNLIVRGCEFQEAKPQIELGWSVRRAVITDNLIKGKLRVVNRSGGVVSLRDNASDDARLEIEKK